MRKPKAAKPVIHISTMGNLANQMIQYMVALALADRVGRPCAFSNVHLPVWGIEHPFIEGTFTAQEIVQADAPDLGRLAASLADGSLQKVDIRTYGQRIENFLPPEAYRRIFGPSGRASNQPTPRAAGPGEVLCNIRQGDVADGHHPDYVQIPVAFYEQIVAATGLAPVFLGQLDETPYLSALRQRFPHARFEPSLGALADFLAIQGSTHIIPSISTFGWLAAWLSDAQTIHHPVLGLLHPLQSRGTNLLPLDDPRYRFTLFPYHYAVPATDVPAAHATLAGLWRDMTPARLRTLTMPHHPPRQQALHLDRFDEAYYLQRYPDIAASIAGGHIPSGRHHYESYGFAEERDPFFIDRAWYCATYPMAALELGQGDYADVHQHWLELGCARGYRRHAGMPS